MNPFLVILATALTVAGHLSANPDVRSIREWVNGDGKTDDTLGVAAAFAACKNNAFTLQVDCPVLIHVGMDISRPIFVDNGTHVEFTNEGLFITDNVLIPAFVIANSSDIRFTGLNLEYRGGLPVNWDVGGYYDKGGFVPVVKGYAQPAFAFNDRTVTSWLKDNRTISFGNTKEAARSTPWHGPTNSSTIFMLVGAAHNISFSKVRMSVPLSAGGSKFIPMAFSFTLGYDSNREPVAPGTNNWITVPNVSVPSDIHFSDITLDGYYMGFQGTLQNSTFSGIVGKRYADLQDDAGGNVGGMGKWFAPPHLFYINYSQSPLGDNRLSAKNLTISNVNDIGPRIGVARDVSEKMKRSGYANSLKIGAVDSTVTNYTSTRPDGLADILGCDNLTLTNITGTYDSSFINGMYPGVRFPGHGYKHLTLNNVTLTDTAENPYGTSENKPLPFGGNSDPLNAHIQFNKVTVNLNRWSRPYPVQSTFAGLDVHADISFNIKQPK